MMRRLGVLLSSKLILALVCSAMAGFAASRPVKPPWKVVIVKVGWAATLPMAAPKLQGQMIEALQIEDASEALHDAIAVQVRVRNASRLTQKLRWDVAKSPHLRISDSTIVAPIGHRLSGLSENSLAARGVLEVQIPAGESYDLYPVFAVNRLPKRVKVTIDGVGTARLPP
jgi:hypothetical protein